MRNALIAAIVAAVVGAGSAGAASWGSGSGSGTPAPPHPHPRPSGSADRPAAPLHPKPSTGSPRTPDPHSTGARPTQADVQQLVAAWSAAHPGWTNPIDMTHEQLLQAEIDHPAVYAPELSHTSKARRLLDVYGSYVAMSPKLRALLRKQGVPIPAGLPYVKLNTHLGAQPTTK